MKRKNKLWIALIFISFVAFTIALQISNFDGFSTSENLTFTGDENITRNITFFRYLNVSSATLDLKGYLGNSSYLDLECNNYDSPIQIVNNSYKTNIWSQNFTADKDSLSILSMYFYYDFPALAINDTIYINIGTTQNATDVISTIIGAYEVGVSLGTKTWGWYNISIDAKNLVIGEEYYYTIYSASGTPTNSILLMGFDTTGGCYSGGTAMRDFDPPIVGSTDLMFRTYNNIYPTNASLDVALNGTLDWEYAGEFNTSESITDFSSQLNNAVNDGACDCTGCTLSGNNCTINFTFHSDTEGVLEYSNLNITWNELVAPTINITLPDGEYNSTEVPFSVNATDNWETDFCTYWVTRGASTEISNTTVTCSDSISGNLYVSSTGTDYVFHFFVNDTSGNTNYSNSSFSTSSGAVIITPPSSGGGSSTIIVGEDAGWTMEAGGGQGISDVNLVLGTSQIREVLFENLGDESIILTLSCEDVESTGCKFVTFESETVTLPLIQDIKTGAEFKMTAPEIAQTGKYIFNVVATDERGKEGRVSVVLIIKETGFLSKITARTEGGFPYILIAIITFMISMIVSLLILNKIKSKIKPLIAFGISFLATYLVVLIF